MSRHTYVRNMNVEEEYEDDEYGYGSSYGASYGSGSEYGLSSSVEKQYMFRRDQSGTTPKMENFLDRRESLGEFEAEFEMDLGVGCAEEGQVSQQDKDPPDGAEGGGRPPGVREAGGERKKLSRQESRFDASGLSSEEKIKLLSVLEHIFDIVGDSVPENVIKQAIVRCNYNAEAALDEILSKPSDKTVTHSSPSPPKRCKLKIDPTDDLVKTPATVVKAVPSSKRSVVGFEAPVMTRTKENSTIDPESTPVVVVDHKSVESLKHNQRSRSNSPLPNRMETLNLENTPISSGRVTPETGGASSLAPTPLKQVERMRKEKIDAVKEYEKIRGGSKEMLNLVVIGHVDSGKSTLMGHLLFRLGNVSQKVMHKYEKESKKVGKQSFMYAWVLDETDEERDRGITMDVGQNKFETEHRIVTLLDAPGHRDFIPNMISGAYQADVAVLVVNATTGEFEAGFEAGGQTREHALLVRSLGVSQLVVAVNKLDTVSWSQDRFTAIKNKLRVFLTKQAGYREADLTFVPCSGLTGENLTSGPTTPDLSSWYGVDKPSLVQAIDSLRTTDRSSIDKPFRLAISDVFRGQSGSGFSVAGRVESGFVTKDDRVLVSPLNEVCTVRTVLVEMMDGLTGYVGDHVTLTLVGADQTSVTAGMVLSDPSQPIPVTSRFQARIVVFNIDVPITKGYPVVLHYGCVAEQATLKKLVSLLNKSSGEVVKSKPRCLTGNCTALVEVVVSKPIPVELYKSNRELGRFMLRTGGHTIAAGVVTEIL